jgi:hypothetical protein
MILLDRGVHFCFQRFVALAQSDDVKTARKRLAGRLQLDDSAAA